MKLLKLTRLDGLTVAINPDTICYFAPPVEGTEGKGAHAVLMLMNGSVAVTESFVEIMEMLNDPSSAK